MDFSSINSNYVYKRKCVSRLQNGADQLRALLLTLNRSHGTFTELSTAALRFKITEFYVKHIPGNFRYKDVRTCRAFTAHVNSLVSIINSLA